MSINKDKLINSLIFFFLIYFCISYFFKLNYVIGNRDEINYLSDSLLLLEGIRPAHSHSPSGISTWFGSLIVILDFLINKISFVSIEKLFTNFDLILYKHYQNLTYIKSSLFFLNSILLFYLFFLDKKKIFFLIFFSLFLLPQAYEITFAGTPYFIASILCAVSFLLKDKNKFLSLIFFGLALSERIEFLLLINYISLDNQKFNLKNYFTIFITFLIVSPWFSVALIQNIKAWVTILYHLSDNTNEATFLPKILLILFVVINFTYAFINNKKIKIIYLLLLFLSILYFYFSYPAYIRWLIVGFVLLSYELNLFINKKENYSKILLVVVVLSLLTFFNNKNYTSDDQLLKIEKSSSYNNVIGVKLLKEELNFKNYNQLFVNYVRKHNIKNINFFKKENAPLSFGESGNFEKFGIRRYQFLLKYGSNDMPNKYIRGKGGLYYDEKKWCEILNNKDSAIITSSAKSKISIGIVSLTSCENIN